VSTEPLPKSRSVTRDVRQQEMQPSSSRGRSLRLWLLPISWAVAFAFLYLLLLFLASVEQTNVRGLFQRDTHWILACVLPGFLLGKVFGLMTSNLIALAIPPFRRTFEEESRSTGRHGFAGAMTGLLSASAALAFVTAIGSLLFLKLT